MHIREQRDHRTGQMLGGLTRGPGELEHIFAQTSRMPVLAGGNADVDKEMLIAASFAILVNHDHGDREAVGAVRRHCCSICCSGASVTVAARTIRMPGDPVVLRPDPGPPA